MKSFLFKLGLLIILLAPYFWAFSYNSTEPEKIEDTASVQNSYWLALDRDLGKEYLYYGVPGELDNSKLEAEFQVKIGASWSPTPLPQLLGKEYWVIVDKVSSEENPETAPYFLQLDVPTTDEWPYGPVPYTECKDLATGENIQCDWVMPGYFGLHGVNGNDFKLSSDDYGSSGCIRHRDEDITYLYNLLDPKSEEIRYYVLN
jgi:lipoprotein-anchoring transpeptidase ErfK/SrfK